MRRASLATVLCLALVSCVADDGARPTASAIVELRATVQALEAEVRAVQKELAETRARAEEASHQLEELRAEEAARRRAEEEARQQEAYAQNDLAREAARAKLEALAREQEAARARETSKCKAGSSLDPQGRCRPVPTGASKPRGPGACNCPPGDLACATRCAESPGIVPE